MGCTCVQVCTYFSHGDVFLQFQGNAIQECVFFFREISDKVELSEDGNTAGDMFHIFPEARP